MSLLPAMRSDWYGWVKKKSKHSAGGDRRQCAPASRPPSTAAMSTGTTSASAMLSLCRWSAQRDHRDRKRERAEHTDREADEVGAVFGLAGASTQRVHVIHSSVVRSRARLRSSTFTVFSPRMPSWRFWVCAVTSASTCATGLRASTRAWAATRCGRPGAERSPTGDRRESRPEADAVTASTGTVAAVGRETVELRGTACHRGPDDVRFESRVFVRCHAGPSGWMPPLLIAS